MSTLIICDEGTVELLYRSFVPGKTAAPPVFILCSGGGLTRTSTVANARSAELTTTGYTQQVSVLNPADPAFNNPKERADALFNPVSFSAPASNDLVFDQVGIIMKDGPTDAALFGLIDYGSPQTIAKGGPPRIINPAIVLGDSSADFS